MNPETLFNTNFLFLSGLVSYIIYYFTQKLYLGLGGRPGTIAFLANIITFLLVCLISFVKNYKYFPIDYIFDKNYYANLNIYIYIYGPSICILGSILVYYLAEYLKSVIEITHRTVAYGIICMFGCMFLLSLTTEFRVVTYSDNTNIKITYGEMYINFWHIGTLSGLTIKTKYREDGQNAIFNYIAASLLSSLIGLGLMGVVILGGKHGLCAFLGNVIYIYYLNQNFPLQEKSGIKTNEFFNQVINNNNNINEVKKGNYQINKIQFNEINKNNSQKIRNGIITNLEIINNNSTEIITINKKDEDSPYKERHIKKDNQNFDKNYQQMYENDGKNIFFKNGENYSIESFYIKL